LSLPLSVMLPRKTKADVRWALNLNNYRNAHYILSNQAKHLFAETVKAGLAGLETIPTLRPPLHLQITLWVARKCDLANVQSVVEKFYADAIVGCQVIADDNCDIIQSGGYDFGGIDRINPRAIVRISEK
jgi:hypothetical protein